MFENMTGPKVTMQINWGFSDHACSFWQSKDLANHTCIRHSYYYQSLSESTDILLKCRKREITLHLIAFK